MAKNVEQARKTRVNKVLGNKAEFIGLSPAQLPAATCSIIIGIVIGGILDLNFAKTIIHMAWPFAAWIVVTGNRPGRFIAHFSRIPKFKRQRRKRKVQWSRNRNGYGRLSTWR